MKFSQHDIIEVPEDETVDGWCYDHVQITSPFSNEDTSTTWLVDAIPCRITDTEIVHAPEVDFGIPTRTESFITNVTRMSEWEEEAVSYE